MTRRPRVLLTDPVHQDVHRRLEQEAEIVLLPQDAAPAAAEAALKALLPDVDGLIVRRKLPDDLFDTPNRLRGVVRHGVGLDFIPVAQATANRIPVANLPGINAHAVAEYVFAGLLTLSRQLGHFSQQVREGNWQARRSAGSVTFDLRGRTLGVVGYGAIGRRVGEIAQHAFAMQVVAHTTTPARLPPVVRSLSLPELFAASDFVVLACPLTPQTRGLVNSALLAHAPSHAVLVNVSRGAVVCESDLVAALEAGRLGGAVLDVFEVQPLPEDSGLRRYPGVILTPHLAGITADTERATGLAATSTMLALIRGERPDNIVNKEIYAEEIG